MKLKNLVFGLVAFLNALNVAHATTVVDGTNVNEVTEIDAMLKPGQFISVTEWNQDIGMIRTAKNGLEQKIAINNLAIIERYCQKPTVVAPGDGSIACYVRSNFGK